MAYHNKDKSTKYSYIIRRKKLKSSIYMFIQLTNTFDK